MNRPLNRPQQHIYNYLMDNANIKNVVELLFEVQEGYTHVPENICETFYVLTAYEYVEIINKVSEDVLNNYIQSQEKR